MHTPQPNVQKEIPNSEARNGLIKALIFTADCVEATDFGSPEKVQFVSSMMNELCEVYSPAAKGLLNLSYRSAEEIKKRVLSSVGKSSSGVNEFLTTSSRKKIKNSFYPSIDNEDYEGVDNLVQSASLEFDACSINNLSWFVAKYPQETISLLIEIIELPPQDLSKYMHILADALVLSDGYTQDSPAFSLLIEQVIAQNEGLFCRIILGLGLVKGLVDKTISIDDSMLGRLKRKFNILKRDYVKYWNFVAQSYWSKRDISIPGYEQIIYKLMYYGEFALSSGCSVIDIPTQVGASGIKIHSSLILEILRDGIYLGHSNDKKVAGKSRDLLTYNDIAVEAIAARDKELVKQSYGSHLKNSWEKNLAEKSSRFSFDRKSPTAMIAYELILELLAKLEYPVLRLLPPEEGDFATSKSLCIRAQRGELFSKTEPYFFVRFNRFGKLGDTHPNFGQIIINIEFVNGSQSRNGHLGIVNTQDMPTVFNKIIEEIPLDGRNDLKNSLTDSFTTVSSPSLTSSSQFDDDNHSFDCTSFYEDGDSSNLDDSVYDQKIKKRG
jgi:hypothetical protein